MIKVNEYFQSKRIINKKDLFSIIKFLKRQGNGIFMGNQIIGFRKVISQAKNKSKENFFTWFNSAKNTEDSFKKGKFDFFFHIFLPIKKFLRDANKKTILEIGHGGCRILAAAAAFFNEAIGVDIHNENAYVLKELNKRGINNVKLFKTDGRSIPVPDCSIDVVYSFIVLQHVEKIDIFKEYLKETYRVLRFGGIAILYFGRLYKFSFNRSSKILYLIDRIYEKFRFNKGYLEIPNVKINHTNLRISLAYAKKYVKSLNFKNLKTTVSYRQSQDRRILYGSQNGLLLKK